MSRFVRVYFRNGKSTAHLEGPDLDKIKNRKVPFIIHSELAVLHQCSNCQIVGPWGPDWMAYPIWDRIAGLHRKGQSETIFCSRSCWIAETGGFDLPDWMNFNREPNRPKELTNALWHARRLDLARLADQSSYRRVPMPLWPGNGHCKWCQGKIDEPRRRSWHAKCAEAYLLHSDLAVQSKAVRKRDGRLCQHPGCDGPGEELDHKRPLWSVRDLPDGLRRPFYGPSNLQFLCHDHHSEKSAKEAALRAARRLG